jgi:hypothetical protein
MGLEGIVSKHRDRTYKAGRSPHWVKVKNPKSPAMLRAEEGEWWRAQPYRLDTRRRTSEVTIQMLQIAIVI